MTKKELIEENDALKDALKEIADQASTVLDPESLDDDDDIDTDDIEDD